MYKIHGLGPRVMIHSIFSTRKQKIEMGKEIAIIAAVRYHGYIDEIESLFI